MASLPLRYWCHACGTLLFRSSSDAAGIFEAVCHWRECPDGGPRAVRVPEDAAEQPRVNRRQLIGARRAGAQIARSA